MQSNTNNFLTRQQAADYLGLKKATLEAWATHGGGPTFCKFGRAVRYRKQDLDEFVERSLVKSTSEINCER